MNSIETANAPQAIGPYSQAIDTGTYVFVSGQLPLDAKTGEIVKGDIGVQTAQSLQNIRAILAERGLTMSNVVKTTIFVTDIGQFGKVNEVYGTFFAEPYPARVTVEVSKLPKGAMVEIEVIAMS